MQKTIKLTEPQHRFIFSRAKFPAMIGGLGSGKSQGGTYRVIKLMTEDVGISCAYYFPTYDLVKLRGMAGLMKDLELFGIEYEVNKSEYLIRLKDYGDVIFRSYDNPERIVAYEVAHSIVDELDTLNAEKAEFVWRKVVERNRQPCNHEHGNTVGCVTTPDRGQLGFVFKKWGGTELQDGYELIKASTYSNPFLPPEYIDSIRKNYDEDLFDLYINGEFVSLNHRSVFDKQGMRNALANCWKPIKRMTLNLLQDKFIEHEQGELRVWSLPEAGKKYVIGADVARGLSYGDYSSADVLELPEGNQVAQWHGHIPPDKYANVLKVLGLMYNKALIGVEDNNHGLTTNILLRDDNYPNLYVQRAIDDGYSGEREQSRIGWTTTKKSKDHIIDMLDAELRNGTHGMACKETAEELQTYVIHEDGSYGAQQGCYDDRVMSRAIAGEMLRQSPFYKKSEK